VSGMVVFEHTNLLTFSMLVLVDKMYASAPQSVGVVKTTQELETHNMKPDCKATLIFREVIDVRR
jgi:hypothetical protein